MRQATSIVGRRGRRGLQRFLRPCREPPRRRRRARGLRRRGDQGRRAGGAEGRVPRTSRSWSMNWRRASGRRPRSGREVFRPWGSYDSLESRPGFQVKRLTVLPGAVLSLQLHHRRAEHWVVVSGTARITRDDEVFDLRRNQHTFIPLGARHRIENPGTELLRDHRGAGRRLPGRGRHRALRGPLRAPGPHGLTRPLPRQATMTRR